VSSVLNQSSNPQVRLLLTRAKQAQEEDRPNEALRLFIEVLRISPGEVDALVGSGRLCLLLGDPGTALEQFTAVLVRLSNHVDSLHGRGVALYNLGLEGQGLSDLDRALSLDPGHLECRLSRAQLLMESGRFADAVKDLELALREAPEDVDVLLELCRCRLTFPDIDAVEIASQLARLGTTLDGDPLLLLLEAELALRTGARAEGTSKLEEALGLEPELAEVALSLQSCGELSATTDELDD